MEIISDTVLSSKYHKQTLGNTAVNIYVPRNNKG